MMKINNVMILTGLSDKQIRHYEKIGLLPPVARNQAGYRHYSRSDIERLHFIARSRKVGFSLSAIRQLLIFYDNPKRCS